MAKMRQNLEGPGFLRCQCGTRLMLVNGHGECLSCGKDAEAILRDRIRVCALDGCTEQFQPEYHQQRCCCPDHTKLYELQEQRKRRAKSAHERRKVRSAAQTREKRRKAAKAEQARWDGRRVHLGRVRAGLAPVVADPFAGDVAHGVPWCHAWAGLDPLPAGGFPVRFKQNAVPAR